jgi:hypothetical protein
MFKKLLAKFGRAEQASLDEENLILLGLDGAVRYATLGGGDVT